VLRQCLQNDSVSIVVACREDAAQGLESLRFQPDIPQFDLPRLEPGLVRLIVDRLTERPADKPVVIAEPEGGWTALRDRLVDDLEARGQVLPQQLKVALGGLRTLRRLTPAAYARAGRLAGLEAAFVAGAIARAAHTSELGDEDVLRLLLPLIDRTRQPPDKGPPQPARVLAEAAGAPEHAASRALDRLEADEIVRPRGELQDAALSWQLDHAYLAQPILRIERERDQWHRLLVERAQAYAEASWRDKWNALLPLRMQARLVGARLRRRFRYQQQRGYALKSLARLTPAIAVIGVVGGLVWGATEWDVAGQIEDNLLAIGTDVVSYLRKDCCFSRALTTDYNPHLTAQGAPELISLDVIFSKTDKFIFSSRGPHVEGRKKAFLPRLALTCGCSASVTSRAKLPIISLI
jgi:hypothetical protein